MKIMIGLPGNRYRICRSEPF